MTDMWARLRRFLVRDRDDSLRRRRPGDAERAVVGAIAFLLLATNDLARKGLR